MRAVRRKPVRGDLVQHALSDSAESWCVGPCGYRPDQNLRGSCESLARSLDDPESALVYASRVDARQVDAAASTNGAFLRASLRISGLRPGFAKSDLNALCEPGAPEPPART